MALQWLLVNTIMVDVCMSADRVDKVAEMQWQPVCEINEEHFIFFSCHLVQQSNWVALRFQS